MEYILKKEVAEDILNKYKNNYICDKTDLSKCYVSLILHRRRRIPKYTAYAFTKTIDNNAELEDFFEEI